MKFLFKLTTIASFSLSAATLFLAAPSYALQCDFLFRESPLIETQNLLDPSWVKAAEVEYGAMLVDLGVARKPGEPLPEHSAGTLIYSYSKRHPAIDNPLLKIGFSVIEQSQRFGFPQTFGELVSAIQSKSAGNFRIATYSAADWYRLDQPMAAGATPKVETDMQFVAYARVVASGYTPLWPARSSLGLLHGLAHVTEYIEHPTVFPALQKFYSFYLSDSSPKNSDSTTQTRLMQRSNFFNEVSYILKPSKYSTLETLLVTEGNDLGSLPVHTKKLREALRADTWGTLEKIKILTDAFDELFFRHGGGARDFWAVDTRLSQEIIEAYVAATKADPTISTLNGKFPSGFLHEFIESPEGLKRQIQYVSHLLESDRSEQLQNFLAYRVAQLEVALLTQRRLELTQVDIIENSMLPIGADSKTSRYMQAYLPPTAKLARLYNTP